MPPTQFILSDKFRDVGSGDARYSPLQGAAVAFGDNRAQGGKGAFGALGTQGPGGPLGLFRNYSEWKVIQNGT